jgi:two-component system cell cycle sensor histidine kinase/response regulator CckA
MQIADDLRHIRGDQAQLEQVLMNLVINARDAMPDGGELVITMSNVIAGEDHNEQCPTMRDGQWVKLEVSDTGMGMSQETRQRIFEPFFTTKDPGKGTGLGLSTTYGIVQQFGGCICVDSAPGKGTRFELCFPAMEGSTETGKATIEFQPRTTRVLVVDDEEAIRNLVTTILRAEGYQVAEASDPESALELMRTAGASFDLMVCDVVMPGTNGPALVEQLRAEGIHPRVIFVSGNTRDLLSRFQAGTKDVVLLQKPFPAKALLEAVRERLQKAT